jgi:phage-related protein
LRKEDRVILRTEQGRKIIIRRIIPEEWKAFRIYEKERIINENKREITLFDNRYTDQLSREFIENISEK